MNLAQAVKADFEEKFDSMKSGLSFIRTLKKQEAFATINGIASYDCYNTRSGFVDPHIHSRTRYLGSLTILADRVELTMVYRDVKREGRGRSKIFGFLFCDPAFPDNVFVELEQSHDI